MVTEITAPTPGSTLRGAVEVFRWDLGGIPIESSWLYVGSTVGGSQYAARATAATTATSVGELPTDGSTIFVRVWYRTSGSWRFLDEQYTAADSPAPPFISRPAPGSPLTGGTQEFRWSFNELPVDSSWLYVGSMVGGSEYAAVSTGTTTSATVSRLPTDESVVNVRLYFKLVGVWYHVDSAFDAGSLPPPSRDELTRELQGLIGETADGQVGPRTRAALNRNWLGRPESFDPTFAERFTNDAELVTWVKRRINTRARLDLELNGTFDAATESVVRSHLGKSGVVAVESFLTLLDPS